MADISVERKTGGMTWLWALLAVAAVIGFMLWLYVQSQEVEATAAVEGDTAAVAQGGAMEGEAAELAAIAGAPDSYAGRTLQVAGVPVAATVGPKAFWGDVPGQNPFLVVLGPSVETPEALASGQRYTVVGSVRTVDEAALAEWVQAGAISEAQRDEASFATHALVAEQATPAGE